MVYNLTNFTSGNSTSLLTVVQGINTNIMSNTLGIIFLIGVCIVIWTSIFANTNDVGKATGATSFIAFTLSLTLVGLGLMPQLSIFITLILAAIAIATTWGSNG